MKKLVAKNHALRKAAAARLSGRTDARRLPAMSACKGLEEINWIAKLCESSSQAKEDL